jgi:ubiquinone/menaquinone biosynthesis C-methylase UbiE
VSTSKDLIRSYYASFDHREWDRLTWPEGVIEFAITQDALQRHLPEAGRVLDIGGATGRWTFWLASRGYSVTLADLSPNLLQIAKEKISEAGVGAQIESISVCDVCDLSQFAAESFDAVLCLGPFYHLIDPQDRVQAARELRRVLKPDGVAFVAFMPVYGFLRRTLALKDERKHLSQPEFMERLMREGVFINTVPGRFNSGYGVRPLEVESFMKTHGFSQIELLADTGFAGQHADALAELAQEDPGAYQVLMNVIVQTAGDASLLGGSVHLLYIGKRS